MRNVNVARGNGETTESTILAGKNFWRATPSKPWDRWPRSARQSGGDDYRFVRDLCEGGMARILLVERVSEASLSFEPPSFRNKNSRCMSVRPVLSSDLFRSSSSSEVSGEAHNHPTSNPAKYGLPSLLSARSSYLVVPLFTSRNSWSILSAILRASADLVSLISA